MSLDARQVRNVRLMLKGVKQFQRAHGYSEKEAQRHGRLVLMTSLVETSLYNYANANVPQSVHYPHDPVKWQPDGLGHDHDSVGCFQQRAGGTWSPATSVALKMKPDVAARAFLTELRRLGLAGYGGPGLGTRCQRVQRSAYPGRYRLQAVRALAIRRKYWRTA